MLTVLFHRKPIKECSCEKEIQSKTSIISDPYLKKDMITPYVEIINHSMALYVFHIKKSNKVKVCADRLWACVQGISLTFLKSFRIDRHIRPAVDFLLTCT